MAKTQTITRVSPVSLGKIQGLIGAIFGFLGGLGFGFFAFVMSTALSQLPTAKPVPNLGFVGIIIFPLLFAIIYGIMGFLIGAITALVYNLVAKWVGGIEIDLE